MSQVNNLVVNIDAIGLEALRLLKDAFTAEHGIQRCGGAVVKGALVDAAKSKGLMSEGDAVGV